MRGDHALAGAIADPFRIHRCYQSAVNSSALSTVRSCLRERGRRRSGGGTGDVREVGERTKELKLATIYGLKGCVLMSAELGISSPLPARSSAAAGL